MSVALAPAKWRERARYENHGAQITSVVDGDTVRVRMTRSELVVTIRVLGVDTLETRKPNTRVECGGPEATATMTTLGVPAGGAWPVAGRQAGHG